MKITVQYDNQSASLDVDVSESIEFFRYQLFSLTDIPPLEQQLIGVGQAPLNDAALLSTLKLNEGATVLVKRQVAKAAEVGLQSLHQSEPIDLQSCCSRAFVGSAPIVQPCFTVNNGAQRVCGPCATTCHVPNTITASASMGPFQCQCQQLDNHMCLYAARVHSNRDVLFGNVQQQALRSYATGCKQQHEQLTAKGKTQFQNRIMSFARAMVEYENPSWQSVARELIPIDVLEERARARLASGESKLAWQDESMEQLLKWFKHEFFTWVNSPNCDVCNSATNSIGATGPNPSELPFRPGVVELYKCSGTTCNAITRFPRYNHALKLLQTRKGRCGEWAQAFTLCARSVGFEVRSANDWTDHVWTEYYSEALQRWVHVDSCEASRDNPFLYEAGWGKKLNYVIGVSVEEIVDITQRYTQKWNEVVERRTLCPESWLKEYIESSNSTRFNSLPAARQSVLSARRLVEEREFERNVQGLSAAPQQEQLVGRTTGSVEWRMQRGELGSNQQAVQRALASSVLNKSEEKKDSNFGFSPMPAASTSSSSSSSSSSTSSSSAVCTPSSAQPRCTSDPIDGLSPQLASVQVNDKSKQQPTPATDAEEAKKKTKALFQCYFSQLSVGCGRASCTNSMCRSNPSFVPPAATALAKLALELTTKHSQHNQLCAKHTP